MNSPFDLKRMLEEMNSQLEETTQWWTGEQSQLSGRRLPVDILDEEDELVVAAELPGFDSDDIEITITDQTLWITAHRSEDQETEQHRYHRKERRSETMKRSVRLPAPVLTDEASATLQNGILTLTLPKTHAVEDSNQIEIQPQ